MEDLNKYRMQIDELDKSIMDLLDQRLNIVRKIGRVKKQEKIATLDKNREIDILKSADKYKNSKQIKDIYSQIFKSSKDVQEYNYFLVGKSLDYSYSPKIYSMLGINNYNLFPTESFNVVKQFDFKGINVTNPYKKEAYKYCNELDESAKITEVVNTIIRKNNKLIGYNTDYFGFSMLLEYNNIEVNNKNIVIIGNGATANTITKVLYSKGASNIVYLVRNLRDNNEYSLDDYLKFKDYEIIINATPYGTFPNNQMNPLFNLDEFINLKAVIDVVYNPKRTPLLLSAKENVKKISGLYMLVAQAAMAASLYSGIDKLGLINEVYRNLCNELTNIVLIGMPYSGKSKLARELSQATNLKLVDLDLVMKAKNVDLESILKEGTVEDFRALEKEYALNYAKEVKQIISTGGGIVLSKKAMTALKQNGVIVFLDVPLAVLKSRIDDTRPLIRSEEDLIKLYNERIDLYKKYADITIESTDNIDLILEKIYEHINH